MFADPSSLQRFHKGPGHVPCANYIVYCWQLGSRVFDDIRFPGDVSKRLFLLNFRQLALEMG